MIEKALLKHFNIEDHEVQNLISENTIVRSPLETLLEKKRIDELAYLAWAKNHYQLPVLKESFLSNDPQVENLLSRYHNVFPKSVIPFHEWEGILYVMCLEPVPFEAPQTIQYVLAPYSVIQKWQHLNSTASEDPLVSHSDEVLESSEESQEPSTKLFEIPDGLQNLENLDKLDFSNLSLPNESENPKNEEETSAPEGLTVSFEPKESPPEPQTITKSQTLTQIHDVPKAEKKDLHVEFPSLPEESQHKYVVQTPISSGDLKEFKSEQKPETPSSTAKENSSHLSLAQDPVTHTGIIIHPDAAIKVLDSMKKYFDQTMILIVDRGNLKPFKWDSSWNKQSHTQSLIDLSSASVFRIVYDTHQAYHGYVIPNSINDSFFQAWNKGVYPEHLTIYPVTDKKNLLGMILGTCSKVATKKFQLHHIEAIAKDCLNTVLKDQILKAS